MHVYVSPTGDGTGVVLRACRPIPDQEIADSRAATSTQMPDTMKESVAGGKTATASRAAITAGGLPVVFVYVGGEWGAVGHLIDTLWGVVVQNVPGHDAINKTLGGDTSHAEAQTKAQALASQYGAQAIDAG